MKLTKASSYALQAVAYLTQQKDLTDPVASKKIAEVRKIPERFLLKVLKPLVEKGLLTSVKGPGGGYKLARPAAQISLADIIEAIDEDGLRGFNAGKKIGNATINNRLEAICKQTAESVRAHLETISVDDLVGKSTESKPKKK